MNKKIVRFLIYGMVTLLLFWILSIPVGPLPPLGPLMNPTTGFWANAETQPPSTKTVTLHSDELSEPVTVYFDRRHIPHIFARNDRDLFFAQGYITARDRLWQMEFQTRAAAGRLSEILGPRTLQFDRYRRRIGMVYAAEQALEGMMEDEESTRAIEAYTDGVNAWIEQLDPSQYPVEYKIMDYQPERWTPLKCALLFKNMTLTLASRNNDVRMSNTRAYFGDRFIDEILDIKPELNDPIIPPSRDWNFEPLDPQEPDGSFTPSMVTDIVEFPADPNNGSNNWAVGGSKTASGYPLLANDPHLGLSLPSIWYAVQLHAPSVNAMGVSLPGSPSVVIGFNEDIAWGTTNVSADVWDWYEIDFRDSTFSEYRFDGRWRKTRKRVEKIRVKGGETVVDTVVYTHHGPVVETDTDHFGGREIPRHHAVRWIAYAKSNEVRFFLKINRARNYDDYREALDYFHSPAQNWVFADSADIALTVTGRYPLKWDEQGRFISDGSDPRYDWQGWIPFDHIPFVKNPEREFVSSANQDPTDDSYPYYLDDDFAPYERGRRINDRLEAMNQITVDSMRQLQLDAFSYHASTTLPVMLKLLEADSLSESELQGYRDLADWNYFNSKEKIDPSLYHRWWDALYEAIWSDEYRSTDLPLAWPDRDQVAQLVMSETPLKWYDDIGTDREESLADLVLRSYRAAFRELEEEFGAYGRSWEWGRVNSTSIRHVAGLPGFGRSDLATDGGGESVNAIKRTHGPSWRMVVEAGPEMKGYGIYPGGQSGNPGSGRYADMIEDWNDGKLYPLYFMKDTPPDDSLSYTIKLK
ncbi:MAG: penicillin acylase family protein [Balneolaceae bacterium]|nr:penicillin acylase family protein [Balneolaceae bacterium]